MFAGIVMLDGIGSVSTTMQDSLRHALSRDPNEIVIERKLRNCFIVRASVGALTDYDGLLDGTDASVSVLAGEPLGSAGSPPIDHAQIHSDLLLDQQAALNSCRGVFCGASYREGADGPTLELFADKLAVRPVYYWSDRKIVVFATALRILEALPFVPKIRNDAGVAETIMLGLPLGDRTIYQDIYALREAEIVRFSATGVSRSSYFRWDRVPQQFVQPSAAIVRAYELFMDAINVRRRGDVKVAAFLSGGMDSRAIVALLHASGASVQAINFSPHESQDQALASAYARQVGIPFLSSPREREPAGGFRLALTEFVRDRIDRGDITAQRPNGLWSGDGGSVAVGSVHMDDRLVSLARNGDRRTAVNYFLSVNQMNFPYRLIKPSQRKPLADTLYGGIEYELERHECQDPAQAFFLFLMTNDQRRHLYDVYEELDLHRLEYQLPFFDSRFLEFIFGLPVEYRNNHRFYTEWFRIFPEDTRKVPWQTYPEHVKCPLPIPANLSYQWRPPEDGFLRKARKRMKSGLEAITLASGAADLGPVARERLLALAAIQLLAIKDYSYAVDAAKRFRAPGRLTDWTTQKHF